MCGRTYLAGVKEERGQGRGSKHSPIVEDNTGVGADGVCRNAGVPAIPHDGR